MLCDSWKSEDLENLRDSGPDPLDFFLQRKTKTTSQDFKNFIPAQSNTVASSSKLVPIVLPSSVAVPSVSSPSQRLTVIMANKYPPLVLPANLHDLPQGYAQRLKQFRVEGDITTQQHFDRFLKKKLI